MASVETFIRMVLKKLATHFDLCILQSAENLGQSVGYLGPILKDRYPAATSLTER